MCVRHIIGRGGVYYSLWPRREENSLTFSYIKSECPGQPRGGGRGFKWLDWCSDPFFKSCKNDKRNSYPFFKVMRKRKLKLISVFQSDAKAKNEIQISKPFFKVRRKRKTKSKIQICFSMSCENEKWIWHLNSFFPCHRETVGTKVHALLSYMRLRPGYFLP